MTGAVPEYPFARLLPGQLLGNSAAARCRSGRGVKEGEKVQVREEVEVGAEVEVREEVEVGEDVESVEGGKA